MALNLTLTLTLLTLVIGLWIGAKFHDAPFIKFFGRNDWFVGLFLILIGYANFISYNLAHMRNASLILIVFGLILVLLSATSALKK